MPSLRILLCLGLAALGCAGCAMTDPYQRDGMWQPTGAIPANIAVMVADPNDLIAGHGESTPTHYDSTIPIDRIMADKPKGLDGSTGSSSGSGTGNNAASALADLSAALGGGN
ncbi:hypothetical protein [Acidisoma silvae]|uniref:Lipoprotein n=1 Tax=Acidisoma silvae TaxID=2802396 RepID=A0A963YT28_9PROT|nr:hypothetical protein [Acidisoma silvae]MCB8875900.1 hypothetical protein [Acidisoma silvae]